MHLKHLPSWCCTPQAQEARSHLVQGMQAYTLPLCRSHLKPSAPHGDQALQLPGCSSPECIGCRAPGGYTPSFLLQVVSELSADLLKMHATLPGSLPGSPSQLPPSAFPIPGLGLKREAPCAPGSGLGKAQVENNYRALWKPESVAETWTRWPETRQRSTVRQCCCPSGLID